MHCTSDILLVSPTDFGFNAETAVTNTFQNETKIEQEILREKVLGEFSAFAEELQSNGIRVNVIKDTPTPVKPDAVFPNNWVSLHADGTVIIYPMCTPNRRLEKRQEILEELKSKYRFERMIDLSHYEEDEKFLEGTGSMVFDHTNRTAYACLSPRTDKDIFIEVCKIIGYRPVYFYAYADGAEIYHTNVMMNVGSGFAVICLDSITDQTERSSVLAALQEGGNEVVDITIDQMKNFAGNMLCLRSVQGTNLLALSQSAYDTLTADQKKVLEKYVVLLPLNVHTIETVGGGSVRCMIAEIFSERLR